MEQNNSKLNFKIFRILLCPDFKVSEMSEVSSLKMGVKIDILFNIGEVPSKTITAGNIPCRMY